MQGKSFMIGAIAAVVGLVTGFLLSNSVNRNEISALRAENEQLKTDRKPSAADGEMNLSEEEIRNTIAKADNEPTNFQTQRNVGVSMYRYGSMKQDVNVIRSAVRVLERAIALKPDDYDISLSLGNAYFDIGYFAKENDAFTKSRTYYSKVLAAKPANEDVVVDVGLTYFLQNPPEHESAIKEFRRALEINPKHEKTLQFLVQSLLKENQRDEAVKYLDQLRAANPRNESIPELTAMLSAPQAAQ